MSLHAVPLPSLAEELDLFVPPRDRGREVFVLPREIVERQLRGNPRLCTCGRRKTEAALRCKFCQRSRSDP